MTYKIQKLIPGAFKSCIRLALFSLCAATPFIAPLSVHAQTPDFGPNVKILDPSMSAADIQSTLNSVNAEAQFSANRYQVFFMPGTYSTQAQVGYYEGVAGLGQSPQSVTINGYLTANLTDSNGNVTDNFWRSLENMTINAPTTLQWAVSQGADFRRMNINGPLQLTNTNCGFASGGFIADTLVTGNVNPCSQQQWYTRNSTIGSWSGGVWNMVFSGVQGAPVPQYPTGNRYTVLPTTPVSREKAFLYVDSNGAFNVFAPDAQRNSSGITWANGNQNGYSLPISTFFIAKPSTALADINNALLLGQNLILTPGIYQYAGSINITNPNTILLGLGYATLVPQNGTPAITVADVDGVQIAGLMIDAGPISSPMLVQVGTPGAPGASHHDNPTWISDVSFRIGGATTGLADTSLEIDSSDVILDNTWIWRADHGQTPVGWTVNVANHGLVVNGDNVTALGLAVEHFEQNQVVWNGNGGETIFYQSELPYDVPSQSAWMNGSANGYSSYSVSSQVTSHVAYGVGVYSFFNQGLPIIEDSAITVPDAAGVTINHAVSVFLNGSGSITHTVNNTGTTVQQGNITSYVTLYQGVPCSTTCPAAPTILTATPISPTQINLTWTASSTPGVLYSVYRSTTSSFTPSAANQIITGLPGLSYADTTASPSSTYYYLVQATNTVGTSAPSNLASAATAANGGKITTDVLKIDSGYTGTTPPAGWSVDGGFTGASTPGSSTTHAITIPSTILNPAPAAVYQTNRRTNGGSFTYTATGLTPGGSYIVDLHFSDNFSTAAKQRQFNVAINGTQVLTNFDIFATAGGEFIANVQSFYAVADTNGIITMQFSNGAANNAQINGIEIGLGSVPVPVAPSGLAASTLSDTQISLNWTASSTSNAVYELFRSTTPGFQPSPNTLVTTTANTSFTDTALTPGTTYYYIVEANNSILTSLPSNQATAATQSSSTTQPTAPAAPTALKASVASSREIDLLWTGSSTHSVTYQLFRSTAPGFTPSSSNLVTTTSATGYSDIGLTEATAYYYVVEATNTNGSSQPSNQVTAQTGGPGSIIAVSGSGQTAQVGTAFANPLAVSVQDAESNPVAGVTVTFVGTGLTFPSGATAVTDSNGQAQVTAQPGSSGTLTISASVDGLSTPASFSETGTAIPQTITFGPLSQVTYGAGPITLSATASSNLPVSFTAAGPATVSGSVLTITGAGQVTVTANQAGDTTYAAASPVSQSFTVAQATPTITWATPAAITYGTALSASQLNATASVPGTFTYSPASGTLAAGAQPLSVTFTPTDTTNYTGATATVVLQVNQAAPTVAWATPATITYGTPLNASQLNATASVPGTFTYSPASGTLSAGAQTLSVTFTPTDTTNYTAATATVVLQVNQAAPTLTWVTPATITYGTALSASQLNATASVPGTFTYSPASGTLAAAAQPLSVTFTPTDTTNYTGATATVVLQVNQAAPTLTWATPAAITYGTPLSASQLNATASVPGTFTYSPASGILSAGAQTLSVTFTPSDTTNYNTNTATVVLQINRATPSITWATPPTITYGTPLSASQLNATASVPGSFSYSPASGIILGAGAQTLSVTFTPADIANYTTTNASVVQRVNPAVLTVTANSLSAPFGTIPTLGATITGFVNGDSNSVVSGVPTLATTANALSLPGTYPITIGSGSLSAANYIFSFVGGTYTVTFTGSVPATGTQCNGAYSGSFSGNITVSANQVCVFVGGSVGGSLHLVNGTVELVQTRLGGNLQISGGTFSITSGTTIAGNLVVQGTPANSATSHVCGSTVKGDLALQSNGTPVLVGNSDGSCPGNTVQGNVTVQSNIALASVLGNTISANLTVQSNSASTVVNGNTLQGNLVEQNNTGDTQVFTNQVRGNLQCSGNTLITGGSNVAASKQGQCAKF